MILNLLNKNKFFSTRKNILKLRQEVLKRDEERSLVVGKVINQIFPYKENLSEDASFCINAYKELGIKPLVLPWLRVGHLKPQVI